MREQTNTRHALSLTLAACTLAFLADAAAGENTVQRLPGGRVGTTYRMMIPASGGVRPYTYSITGGSLPAGLSLDSATGEIEGSFEEAGQVVFTVQVEDSQGGKVSQEVLLRVEPVLIQIPSLELKSSFLPAASIGQPYRVTLAAEGGLPPYAWKLEGKLPAGLVLRPEGEIAGTPATAGPTKLKIVVSDSQGSPAIASRSLELHVTSRRALKDWWRYVGLALIVIGYVVIKQGINDRFFFARRAELQERGLVRIFKRQQLLLEGPDNVQKEFRQLAREDTARVRFIRLVAFGVATAFLYYLFSE